MRDAYLNMGIIRKTPVGGYEYTEQFLRFMLTQGEGE